MDKVELRPVVDTVHVLTIFFTLRLLGMSHKRTFVR